MRARIALIPLLVTVTAAWGAAPPSLLNYQAILRNASGSTLNGVYDMSFTFFDAPTAGSQILIDTHKQFPFLSAVTVSNGLFDVGLGGGSVADGSGLGTYTSLDQVFRDYGTVWMEIQVGPVNAPRETLAPRIRIVSSAYALNAGKLAGQPATNFIDITASTQSKAGALVVQNGITGNSPGAFAVFGNGGTAGGAFQALSGISFAYAGYAGAGHYGIRAQGGDAGGFFRDADSLGTAYLAETDRGMWGSGVAGGIFSTIGRTGYVEMASANRGLFAAGNYGAGELDNPLTGTTGTIATQFGIEANGAYCPLFCGAGGHFANTPYTGRSYAALGETGLWASGSGMGGEFASAYSNGHAEVASGNFGVVGMGRRGGEGGGGGGYFQDLSNGGTAVFGYGSYGIWASAFGASGGAFNSLASGLNTRATAGDAGIGIKGTANDVNNARAAGLFYLGTPGSGQYPVYAYLGSYWSDGPYTVRGNGLKSFVQNHPADPAKQVVYVALEGDEAGTYTRGTGRIVRGEARVQLDPAFAAATNPDVGLTALVTPRGGGPLAIASLTTGELAVRAASPDADGAVFDYAVYGIRLGFEQYVTVQTKDREAQIPPDSAGPPDPASASARFATMRKALGDTSSPDLSRAKLLKEKVRQAISDRLAAANAEAADPTATRGPDPATAPADDLATRRADDRVTGRAAGAAAAVGARPAAETGARPAGSSAPPTPVHGLSAPVPLATSLATGDVAATSGDATLVRATGVPGEIVAGIIGGAGRDEVHTDSAPLALGGSVAPCRVDASFGAIKVGDLLAASTSAGRARLATEADAGAVVGKALEPLAEGAGVIRVLVMSR